MIWVNFLHIYQPPLQSKEILTRVANESYRPLLKGFLKIRNIKINLNINGCLTETFAKLGYQDILEDIKNLARKGKLEFTGSAHYHPLLPFLKKKNIIQQILENYRINKRYFGNLYQPVCFFPPEMAYNPKIGKIVSKLGYKMIILDEISFNGGKNIPQRDSLFKIKNTHNLIVIFRERRISNCIMSATVRSKKEFKDLLGKELKQNVYFCTAMDGETFGHHRPGLEKILFKIIAQQPPKQIFLSELPKFFKIKGEIEPKASTWASSAEDIEKGIQFCSWRDPKNKVHRAQWRFLNYLLKLASKKSYSQTIQRKLNQSQSSDQFFWASGEPWWSVEMIEKGAWAILQTLKSLPLIKKSEIKKGEEYYKDILAFTLQWQRSGKISEKARKYKEITRIPFKERTLEKGKSEVYFAFLELMRGKMWEATRKQNFERAILWRDAIWKLETKNDIYDTIHVVNLLRLEVPDYLIRKIMEKYKTKYEKIKPGQPEWRKV